MSVIIIFHYHCHLHNQISQWIRHCVYFYTVHFPWNFRLLCMAYHYFSVHKCVLREFGFWLVHIFHPVEGRRLSFGVGCCVVADIVAVTAAW